MNIINPTFKLRDEHNIFNIRRFDYDQLLPTIKEIVEPVKEIGFEINEVDLKDTRISSGELCKTIRQTMSIKLQKGGSNIDLTLYVPKIIDNNYVMINGRKKTPLFQLYDIPLITRGNAIKIRTNVCTVGLYKEKESPFIKVSLLGKKVPLGVLLFAYYGMDEVYKKFDLHQTVTKDSDDLYENLRWDLSEIYSESKGYSQDDFILELGRMYSKYNAQLKGEDILYAIDLIPKVDPISMKFFNTSSIIDEIIYVLKNDFVDDTLFTNKRVRCFEYMVIAKVSKIIFDLCFTNRTTRQPKFNTNSKQILSESNVSDIVQFDFSINPIDELTKLSRISLLGPGGFRRENIPRHLRDICPTMYGRVCGVDTPDRDNCGVLQNLIPNVHLDKDLRFVKEICEKQPISIPVSMTPFLKHDDQTRLQMASSQMRQGILLKDFDQPLVRSGCEGLYTDHTQFIKRAKFNGVVEYFDKDYIIVAYDNGEGDIFNISHRKIYVDHMDFMNVNVEVGDRFKAGDILAESNFCKNGNINIGRNLLTGVMVYYGNNYEDGIVISDRLVKDKVLTSIHFEDLSFNIPPDKVLLSLYPDRYTPLPEKITWIEGGDSYAIMKKFNADDHNSIFNEELELNAKRKMLILESNIYANNWCKDLRQYDEWVEKKLISQNAEESKLNNVVTEIFGNDKGLRLIRENQMDRFSHVGKYRIKKEKIDGIRVEMYGMYYRQIQVGDKIANRHGNKGVISKIVPEEKMPKLKDGRHLDICINPLGIISRMNIGQLYELHMAMSVHDLKQMMLNKLNEGVPQTDLKKIVLDYIRIIDRTEGSWYYNQFEEQLPKVITEDFIKELTVIQAPFESCNLDDIKKALKYTNTDFKQKLYDPESMREIVNEIAVGYVYFFRMVHIAEEKLAARGIGAYTRRTLQPLGGRKHRGGQKLGEMEAACLIGHDAPHNLTEFLTTKSDCIEAKTNYIKTCIDPNTVDISKEVDEIPESVKLLNSYLTVIGVDQK